MSGGTRRVGVADRDVLVRASAPGRVNLIGDHTDYTGGWVLPMAVDRATVVELRRHGEVVELVSAESPDAARVPLGVTAGDAPAFPGWSRYVAGVVAVLDPVQGGLGSVSTTVPLGAGLSSSSSLTVAVALALGLEGDVLDAARTCQRAEQLGSGVPGGIMDQLCSLAGQDGRALLIDCGDLDVRPVPVPESLEVIVAHSGEQRELVGSAYAERRAACDRAAELVGPLRDATVESVGAIDDPVLRARARHVVTENARVRLAAEALAAGDAAEVGRAMSASHASLRDDFGVSIPALDRLVTDLEALPGVYGARLTGAGFGGCVVAVADAGTLARHGPPAGREAWVMRPSAGASVHVIT